MGDNQKRILQMLAEGKISVEEATRLLSLVGADNSATGNKAAQNEDPKPAPKYLYVQVEPKEGCARDTAPGRVNIRIPVGLIRAGMKLKALIPPNVANDVNRAMKEKGLNFDIRDIKDEYLEELIAALTDTEINVDSLEAEVRIHAE
jgi:hypothetical protein